MPTKTMSVLFLILCLLAGTFATDMALTAIPTPKTIRTYPQPLPLSMCATNWRGDVRRDAQYYLADGYKLALSCRLDCMSKVSGKVHFDGGCKERYYYYGSIGTCLQAGELSDSQAKIAENFCMNCNGCKKSHNRPFNAASAKSTQGDNSGRLPK
ncbi:papilin [Acrasis kona]|uniref:Papilin n=1 Tax=Acrasis kona TaxID=1008807 RepID=A0AAW2ZP64_9EUKA